MPFTEGEAQGAAALRHRRCLRGDASCPRPGLQRSVARRPGKSAPGAGTGALLWLWGAVSDRVCRAFGNEVVCQSVSDLYCSLPEILIFLYVAL